MSDDELQSGFEIFVVTQHFGFRRRLWYVYREFRFLITFKIFIYLLQKLTLNLNLWF